MSKNDGGPAFPAFAAKPTPGGGIHYDVSGGMTLRDYFAAKAMQGLLYEKLKADNDATIPRITRDAYRVADAMLAERNK